MPANIWLLTLIQSLAMSAATMLVLAGGVLGAQLAPDPKWATMPLAMTVVGTAVGVFPITRLMQHFGRKPIFMIAVSLGATDSLFLAYSVLHGCFYGFIIGTFILGMVMAGIQQIRFAAMESVSPLLAPKAASTVMLGGLVAAILGPELVLIGNKLVLQNFVGAFYLMATILAICCVLFAFIKNTHVKNQYVSDSGRSLKQIVKQPSFVLAVSASVVGYALMSFIMTATPVHMHVIESHSLEHTKLVIQSHIFAMFFPSLFSGWLISKIGVNKVIYLGLMAYMSTIVIALSGSEFMNYWFSLVLLGLGWNFLFLGGTVLLSTSYQPAEKFKVQGLNEFLVFGCQALASLSAGVILNLIHWHGLLMASVSIILIQTGIIAWQQYKTVKEQSFT
ncbi:MFS transporter [Paraglaciecola aquimarina]|uniref:MFS transporter n=1 Tax=Paraglaciecola algarum TaxID=3050085 RepID=A0ABS9D7X0_9ALTE|nr:MFS transporter [Paraglaciecola sp. G1-23]MCF2949048.1 MFS transporter [Paraglaciecola sp. G1-23]